MLLDKVTCLTSALFFPLLVFVDFFLVIPLSFFFFLIVFLEQGGGGGGGSGGGDGGGTVGGQDSALYILFFQCEERLSHLLQNHRSQAFPTGLNSSDSYLKKNKLTKIKKKIK